MGKICLSLSLLSSRRGRGETEIHQSTAKCSLAFLPAEKPSGPRIVKVVILVVRGGAVCLNIAQLSINCTYSILAS